jgi:ketosteroid isomerase-like protein
VLQDAFNRGDVDALVAIYENDATLLVPPGGRSAHGRTEIWAMMAPVLAARPRMTSTVVKTLVGDGWARTHARWEVTGARRPRHAGVPAPARRQVWHRPR